MTSAAADEVSELVENETSAQASKLAKQLKQDALIDVPAEGPAKAKRRKRDTKSTKRTQQAQQTSIAEERSKVKVSGPPARVISAVPEATNSAPAATVGAADFVADPEPVSQNGGFLCTFTLSRPGLVGLNKLAIRLNDLQDSGSIGGWQASGWENPRTKDRALIRFMNRADAIIAIKGVH